MRKKLKIFTVVLCSAAVSLNMVAPYLHAEISQDEINYLGLPIEGPNAGNPAVNYFPDTKFQDYLKGVVDKDGNGYLSDKEIEDVKEINLGKDTDKDGNIVSVDDIESVDGIEVFENLEKFTCENVTSSNGLTLNFYDTGTHTKTERYSNENAKLKYVSCYHSNVKEIKIDKSPELEYLNCSDNYSLSDIDLSANTKLEYLYCSNTALIEPDFSKNTELKVLDCSYKKDDARTGETGVFNPNIDPVLKTLGLDTNAKLEYLDCSGHTALTSLTLPDPNKFADAPYLKGNLLKYIDCKGCGLTGLDLTYATSLQYLNCSKNASLTGLNIQKNTKLEYLDCSDSTAFNTLTIGNDSILRTLDCSNTKVEGLELGNSLLLETLNCAGTELKELDLSKNTALESLLCEERNYDATNDSFSDGTDSKIENLYLNRLLNGKAGLSFNEIFDNMSTRDKIEIDYEKDADNNTVSSNVDIYYTDNALDIINVVAKDFTKPAKFKEKGTERTVTYTNLDKDSQADISEPDKDGDYTLANCTHLYKDPYRKSVINGWPVIVYANGAAQKVTDENGTTINKNSKILKVYTDIAASYKINETNGKTSTGKVVVGITDTPDIPTVTGNRIDGASTLATAKIKNGDVTITAKNNDNSTGQTCYLWIIDTGSNNTYECCPVNILVAPKKIEVRNEKDNDPSLKDATRMIGEELEVRVAGYADTGKTQRTNDSTYSYSIPDSAKDCVEITKVEGSADRFIIKAIGVHNNRDTKVNITFKCDQNNKKIKFVLKVSAAPLVSPTPSAPAPTATP